MPINKPKHLPYSLLGTGGQRKYLTPEERKRFISTCEATHDLEVRTFGLMLAHTGCRITEALELTVDRVDLSAKKIVLESLKKRVKGIYRAVPVPPEFLDSLKMVHDVWNRQRRSDRGAGIPLWTWSRATASVRISELMAAAGISGLHATPKGLRHAFGIRAITQGVQLNTLQKWMGHSDMKTTAIYADVEGAEELKVAERMWSDG
jgi:integrase